MTKQIIPQDQAEFVIVLKYTVGEGGYLRLDNEKKQKRS
jgi:hypothetical protein